MNQRLRTLLILAATLSAACAPPTAPRTAEPSAPGQPAPPVVPNRALVVLARGEPPSFALRAFTQAGGNSNSYTVLNASLDEVDEGGTPHPLLAEALPQVNTDSWRVFPDGRMETTYRLKPNLVWHDGTPLAAEDFAFAWRVYATPALGTSGSAPVAQMEDATAPDNRTLVLRWRQPYAGAGVLRALAQIEGFQALPRHILEQPFLQGDYEAFANHPFWTREYIGLGPYRLDRWEPGASMDAVAFDRYVLGRPKIDRLHILFVTDANAAVASLLSGDGHIAMDYLVMYEQGSTLQQQWAANNAGTVLFSPLLVRVSVFQFRPELMATPAVLDLRFRRALAHAMDKVGLNEALMGGQAIVADGFLSPRASYYASIEAAITRYPYDPRRAQQLLDEAGLQRGADGFYLGPDGRPFQMEVMVLQNPSSESENAIIVEGYNRIGVNAVTRLLPVPLFSDGQIRASYTGILTTGGVGFEQDMSRYSTGKISKPETRWQGTNYGAWTNEAYDRLWDSYNSTLAPAEQVRQLAQMEKILSEELPAIHMFYTPLITPYVAALAGPALRSSRTADNLTHIHEWQWRF